MSCLTGLASHWHPRKDLHACVEVAGDVPGSEMTSLLSMYSCEPSSLSIEKVHFTAWLPLPGMRMDPAGETHRLHGHARMSGWVPETVTS